MARTPDDPTKAQVWIQKGIDELDFEFYFPQGPKGDPGGIVVGSLLPNGTDFNTIITDGRYRFEAITGTSNLPPLAQPYGEMEVITASPGRLTQIVYPGTSGEAGRTIYQRSLAGGIWYGWYATSASRVDQTAGRAIYEWDSVNKREQLIYGDTGWRSLAMDNNYRGTLFLRRVNDRVSLRGEPQCPAGSGTLDGTLVTSIPYGFRASQWIFYPIRTNQVPTWFTMYLKNPALTIEQSPTGILDTTACRLEVSWSTADAWPTTLPGVASGTIPNI